MVLKKSGKKNKKQIIKASLILIGVGVALFAIHGFLFTCIRISDVSMNPALDKGQIVLIQRVGDIRRYDMVLLDCGEDTNHIRRVIGVPGDTLCIRDGFIYINGEILEEYYGKESIYNAGIAQDEIHLEDGEYFVLGDNRNNSLDSRNSQIGVIKRNQIKGKATYRLLPLQGFGSLKNQ